MDLRKLGGYVYSVLAYTEQFAKIMIIAGYDSKPIPNSFFHISQLRMKLRHYAILRTMFRFQRACLNLNVPFSGSEDIILEPEDRISGSQNSGFENYDLGDDARARWNFNTPGNVPYFFSVEFSKHINTQNIPFQSGTLACHSSNRVVKLNI